jgi:hypothetical protein
MFGGTLTGASSTAFFVVTMHQLLFPKNQICEEILMLQSLFPAT